MDFDKLINKLFNILDKINDKGYDLITRTTNLSNELLETLKIIENCTGCKDNTGKYNLDEFHKSSINDVENCLDESEKGKEDERVIIDRLDCKLIEIERELNRKVLCESCKGKRIDKLFDKCKNEGTARLLYESKTNYNNYVRWIPFNEFGDIEYLAKGGFGEVHKATWIHGPRVILKRIYDSNNKISDILKEVKSLIKRNLHGDNS